MAGTLYLHVGAVKSGTTYLQKVLGDNKERLAQTGLLFPGKSWKAHVAAASDIRGKALPQVRRDKIRGAWDQLVAEVRDFDGRAGVISMEWLAAAEPEQVNRMVASASPMRVQMVLTLRDLGRTIPSSWQETCQNRAVWTWPDFLAAISDDDAYDNPAGRRFWRQRDLDQILTRWTDVVAPEQITVVTVPPPGEPPTRLWARFADVLGVADPDSYGVSGGDGNASLGMASAELMRRINVASREARLSPSAYEAILKRALSKRVLPARRPSEPSVRLPATYAGWVATSSAEVVKQLSASGVRVVGDPEDLLVEPSYAEGGPQPIDDASVLAAAVEGYVGLARVAQKRLDSVVADRDRITTERDELRRKLNRVERARAALAMAEEARTNREVGMARRTFRAVRQDLIDLSEEHRSLMRARVGYRRLVNLARRLASRRTGG